MHRVSSILRWLSEGDEIRMPNGYTLAMTDKGHVGIVIDVFSCGTPMDGPPTRQELHQVEPGMPLNYFIDLVSQMDEKEFHAIAANSVLRDYNRKHAGPKEPRWEEAAK